jgi:hypothetical protein
VSRKPLIWFASLGVLGVLAWRPAIARTRSSRREVSRRYGLPLCRHRDDRSFAVQWLACALPCLADACARLTADSDRYSFTVRDLHPLLLAGLPAHSETLHSRRLSHCKKRHASGSTGSWLVCPIMLSNPRHTHESMAMRLSRVYRAYNCND